MTDFYDFTTERRARRIDSRETFSNEIVFPAPTTQIKLYRLGPFTPEQIRALAKNDCMICKGEAIVEGQYLCECTGIESAMKPKEQDNG